MNLQEAYKLKLTITFILQIISQCVKNLLYAKMLTISSEKYFICIMQKGDFTMTVFVYYTHKRFKVLFVVIL